MVEHLHWHCTPCPYAILSPHVWILQKKISQRSVNISSTGLWPQLTQRCLNNEVEEWEFLFHKSLFLVHFRGDRWIVAEAGNCRNRNVTFFLRKLVLYLSLLRTQYAMIWDSDMFFIFECQVGTCRSALQNVERFNCLQSPWELIYQYIRSSVMLKYHFNSLKYFTLDTQYLWVAYISALCSLNGDNAFKFHLVFTMRD